MSLKLTPEQPITLTKVARGATGFMLRHIRKETDGSLIYICASDRELASMKDQAAFFLPEETILTLPAWDCLPYDRVSPHPDVIAARIFTMCTLAARKPSEPVILLTTINAFLQKMPPLNDFKECSFTLKAGVKLDREALSAYLTANGYVRVEKAIEPGEFAVRGSIMDIVSPGMEDGIRLDMFGDDIESIRTYDVLSQLSSGELNVWTLSPMNEILFSPERIERFRTGYREQFGAIVKDDPLYEAISGGRTMAGMEHWLPLFYKKLETVQKYLPDATLIYDTSIPALAEERLATIKDYYEARRAMAENKKAGGPVYHPLKPDELYFDKIDFEDALQKNKRIELTAFNQPEKKGSTEVSMETGAVPLFSTMKQKYTSVFEALKVHAADYQRAGKRVMIGCYTAGSLDRIRSMFAENDILAVALEGWGNRLNLTDSQIGLAVLPIENGFEGKEDIIISEQDLFGERIFRAKSRRRKVENFLAEAANFLPGELVVHKEHGIGKFEGLHTLEVLGAKHDCLKLIYDGDDKLFIPVENIDLISRYGADAEESKLDKLGGVAWQSRKAKLKERIQLAAEALMKTAAERALKTMDAMPPPEGLYDEFTARFPYMETDDQAKAIEEITEDLSSGKPTDRLICGDVGFGKTEVALRAAFIATSNSNQHGRVQVALVCPTTLLARQHFKTFTERFAGLPVTIRQLSRMVSAKDAKQTHKDIEDGTVDIVVGTHALLAESIKFKNLGLLIIDEEQHFGVAQKEKLKSLKGDVHVITLSATPIPRTMQMALSGVRELSLITTPPVDRLAVRTFVTPYDQVILREAILREYHRGGKIFYVTPRVKYIAGLQHDITNLVPEIKVGIAHGQMTPKQLDTIMNDFYDGKFDVLLSTTIVESGLDIPSANTIIIDRAHLLGLSQLYQLRGRVGRGKTRAYCYFTLPHNHLLTPMATKRLEVMQSLDTLGAGFTIASHDMDIRGFGNLLGEEQSGHVREVGVELYQQMLEEAVEAARRGQRGMAPVESKDDWSPQINMGISVLIPDTYVSDLALRLSLYRRISQLFTEDDINSFAAELADRFGALPKEVEHLLAIVQIKQLCKQAGVDRVDVGPNGAILSFRDNKFTNPEKLLSFITKNHKSMKLRHDQKLILTSAWDSIEKKFKGVSGSIAEIAKLAA